MEPLTTVRLHATSRAHGTATLPQVPGVAVLYTGLVVENEADTPEAEPPIKFLGDLGLSAIERSSRAGGVERSEASDQGHVWMPDIGIAVGVTSTGIVNWALLIGFIRVITYQFGGRWLPERGLELGAHRRPGACRGGASPVVSGGASDGRGSRVSH